jgi:hypothetical protein
VTRDQIIDAFRRGVFDTVKPYLWSNDDAEEYLEDALAEACERALLLRDSMTPEICTLTIAAGVSTYLLDKRIIEVTRAKLDSASVPLVLTSTEALDRGERGWQSYGEAGVTHLALDAEGKRWKATLVGTPSAADVLRTTVHRMPLRALCDGKDVPEIPDRLHIRLVDWMRHRAYLKQDAETMDAKKADDAAAAFASAFGPRIDANARRTQRDLGPSVIQFAEF